MEFNWLSGVMLTTAQAAHVASRDLAAFALFTGAMGGLLGMGAMVLAEGNDLRAQLKSQAWAVAALVPLLAWLTGPLSLLAFGVILVAGNCMQAYLMSAYRRRASTENSYFKAAGDLAGLHARAKVRR